MRYKCGNVQFQELIIDIKKYFKRDENTTLFDNRNIIKLIKFENTQYVVKSFKIPHLINKIVYNFFRESKAKRSYDNSVRLIELGINTPKPIGYIEFNSFFLFGESFYVSEYFDYDFEIRAVFKDKDFPNREEILEKFIKFTYHLHNKGVYHIDYSPGNILVKKIEDEYQFFIIDVNRMNFTIFDMNLRMKSMSKLTSDIDDNKLLIKYYSKESQLDEKEVYSIFKIQLENQQKYLENKRKLKIFKGK